MDLTPYVDSIRHDLAAAADAGGPQARETAERLALALEPAVRLVVMDALSQAAAEITAELDAGSVELRLRGREPELVVDVPTPAPAADLAEPTRPIATEDDEPDGGTARITLRLPETVKVRAEQLAAQRGQSLNAWLTTAVRDATRSPGDRPDPGPAGRRRGNRLSGWV